MITYEQKLAHITNMVVNEFSEILTPIEGWIFIKLFWIENRKLKIRGTVEEIQAMLGAYNVDNEMVMKTLRVLKECGLISAKKSEDGVIVANTNLVNKPDLNQKLTIVDSLLSKQLIDAGYYGVIKNALLARNDKKKEKQLAPEVEIKTTKSVDVDFDKAKIVRKVNPDSAPELVKFYYRLMHDVFGGKYESPNLLKEAHQLKLEMQRHGDSAEDTRKFFAFILNGANEKGAFDRVSSMSLYSRLRPTAYQKLIVEKNSKYDKFLQYEEVKKSEDDIMTSVGEIYQICVKNGSLPDTIRTELLSAFDSEIVDEFLKGMGDDKK